MVNVPLTLMLTSARAPAGALDHPAITAAIAEPDLAGILPLALALLRERATGNVSFWAPYISTMSIETPSFAALADEIKGSDLEVHLARRNTLDALAASAVEQALGAEMRDGLAWALSTVRSRAILLTTQSARRNVGRQAEPRPHAARHAVVPGRRSLPRARPANGPVEPPVRGRSAHDGHRGVARELRVAREPALCGGRRGRGRTGRSPRRRCCCRTASWWTTIQTRRCRSS